jgi:Ca-activated chloride channel family protein
VILMSDGVANLGATEAAGILATVEAHRKQGVRLTVLGFGSGAYDDAMLENLADKGDGAYTFIDSEDEAKRVLVDNLAATLHTIASDVKIQVEFNPRSVRSWRQLGYENRALTREQFRDDTVDAGEVGSGQSVTALYDVKIENPASGWIGTVRVRYRDLETGRIEEIERRIVAGDFTRDFAAASPRFRLAAGVAEFAELLRLSPHTFSRGRELADAIRVLRPVALELSIDPQVQELVRLAQAAQSLPY